MTVTLAVTTGLADSSQAPWIETLSWSPRAFLYHNFISMEEADHIIRVGKPMMHRSTVVGRNGGDVEDSIRTSYGTFLSRLQDPIIGEVQKRVAFWTQLNLSHQEDMQVLRYAHGQKYGEHYDSLTEDTPRMATVILYLSDVEEGGETAFPKTRNGGGGVRTAPGQRQSLSACAEGAVAVKPKKGDALLFYSLKPDGSSDPAGLHTGCPVITGVKWTGTIWIHTAPFRPESLGKDIDVPRFPDHCEDYDDTCELWAKQGECERNPKYMLGDAFHLGTCRHACGHCEPCAANDRECVSKNRVKAGYLSLDEVEAPL